MWNQMKNSPLPQTGWWRPIDGNAVRQKSLFVKFLLFPVVKSGDVNLVKGLRLNIRGWYLICSLGLSELAIRSLLKRHSL